MRGAERRGEKTIVFRGAERRGEKTTFRGAERRGEKITIFPRREAAPEKWKINNRMECACWNVGPGRQMDAGPIDFWI